MANVSQVRYAIEMIRSDMGDGGWSLHAHRTDVDDDPVAEYPLLASGESARDDEGEWTSPTDADYELAQAKAQALAELYPLEVA